MPAYVFRGLPPGKTVTVRKADGTTATTGTVAASGDLSVTLDVGDYSVTTTDYRGRTVTAVEELVTPFDPQGAASGTYGAKAGRPRLADVPIPFVMTHRMGGAYDAPDNTLEAMDQAISLGFAVVDAGDWWLGADGTPIAMHDATVDRTTTATGNTADLTATTRNALVVDAGSWFGGTWGNLKVPTMEQVFARADRAVLAFECKATTVAAPMAAYIAANDLQASVLPGSFSLSALTPFAQIGCAVMFIKASMASQAEIDSLVALGVPVYFATVPGLGNTNIATLRAAGIKVVIWTVNRHHQIDEFAGQTIDGYYSDSPLYFRAKVDALAGRGLLGVAREKGLLRLSRDPFSAQTYWPGMQSVTNDLANRGAFAGGNRWTAPYPHRWVLHGEFWPLPDEYTLQMSVRYDAIGSLDSRWAGIFLSADDKQYASISTTTENGAQVWLRVTGSLEAVPRTNGPVGTTVTAATAALTSGTVARLKIQKTATQVIATRLDAAGAVLGTVTMAEARALPYLFLGQNGDNGGDSGLRTSFYNVERVA